MTPLIVTAALIRNNNKILIAQREKDSKHSLLWEFPGGKLEENETPESCLKREILEELNLEIGVTDIFKVVYYKYPERDILLLCYTCELLGGEVFALECNDFKWILIEELEKFSFVGADLPIIDKIKRIGSPLFQIDYNG